MVNNRIENASQSGAQKKWNNMCNLNVTALRILTPLAAALFPQIATADSGNWEYTGSLYAFLPKTDAKLSSASGSVDSSLSLKRALDNLGMAAMGTFEASNGSWSFIADYMYFDLGLNTPVANPSYSGLKTDLTMQTLNGYAAYRVYETPTVDLDIAGGFRWFSLDTDLTLNGTTASTVSAAASESWVDPLVALRGRVQFSEKWYGTGILDYGGFSSDSETWQLLLTAGYDINENWSLRGGYRYISVDHDVKGTRVEIEQSGPVLGVSYRF